MEGEHRSGLTRRETIAAGAAAIALGTGGASTVAADTTGRADGDIAARVRKTPFVDTHEHLVEEETRLQWRPGGILPCDDWALLLSHYLDSDLVVAGLPQADRGRFLSAEVDPERKYALIEPWWPAVKNTGYGRAVRIAMERLYGVGEMTAATVGRIAEGYRKRVRPGFYTEVLREAAGIESCQVNSLETTYKESQQPELLMQDLSILSFAPNGRNWDGLALPAGLAVKDLAGYHRVIDWWFERYGPYAVAVKSQAAYGRRLDFEDVPAERAAPPFRRMVDGQPVSPEEHKAVDDHVFWYCVRKATEKGLPVKLHTGYYAGQNGMPLGRVQTNPADVCDLLGRSPETTFVLMHICYPYQDEMIAVAKHWHNAVIDMCWSWIISPAAAQRFLAEFLVTAPANKVLTFGGDYIPVEPVVGHAAIARQGITRALTRLVEDGWVSKADAVELIDPIMRGNARRIFRVEEKTKRLREAPWLKGGAAS